jgi:hypothetical protein
MISFSHLRRPPRPTRLLYLPTSFVGTGTSKLSHSANGAEYSRHVDMYEARRGGSLALFGWNGEKSRIRGFLLPPEGD